MVIKTDESLANHTTVQIGGTAQTYYIPESIEELASLVREKPELYHYVLSGGSNLLINDQKRFPFVLSMEKCNTEIVQKEDGSFYVGTSVRIQKLITQINQAGFGGIEYLYSLPAMLGGIIYMNAGRGKSYHQSISDHILSVEVLLDGEIRTIQKEDCAFSHRQSVFQTLDRCIILGANLVFDQVDSAAAAERVQDRIDYCRKNQDHSAPSFGSVFRTSNNYIMKLMMITGFGKKDGCHFSKKTKNWMLKEKNGTYADAIRLINRVKQLHKLLHRPCCLEVKIWE